MSGVQPIIIVDGLLQQSRDERVEINRLNLGSLLTIPVSSNSITVTKSFHLLTNTNPGTQNIKNIFGGEEGDLLILFGNGVRLRKNGNIQMPKKLKLDTGVSIMLIFSDTTWFELSRTTI